MENTYAITKKELDRIRSEYGCKGEIIFRTALQYVVEYGQCKFNDKGWVNNQLTLIDAKHDIADAQGKHLWIGREFERAIIECASEIANVEAYSLLAYIQKEVWLSNEGGIDYQRAVELLQKCIYDIEERENCEDKLLFQALENIGFGDDDIEALGFGYLLNNGEEEE